jgi:hypothetical protein
MGIVLLQQIWDQSESGGYVSEIPIDKSVLIIDNIGDAQVTNIGAGILARAFNASTVGSPVRDIYGVKVSSSPFAGSGIIEYQYLDSPLSDTPFNVPPPTKAKDTHECSRRDGNTFKMLLTFFESGVISNACPNQFCQKERCSQEPQYHG